VPELPARVRVALRRNLPSESEALFKNGLLEIDFAERQVRSHGQLVKLTVLEFNLLALRARCLGKLVTPWQLLTDIWGPGSATAWRSWIEVGL
jgi:two-component system, OmpR family, KDP operon response regulator KdpE